MLCILVTMVGTPRGRSGATFVKVLAQSQCGQFCHFGRCGPDLDCHQAEWLGDLWEPSAWEYLLDSWYNAYGMADPISKPAWRYTIGSTPGFWLILSSQNDPLLGPEFHPPCGQLAAPYLYAHKEPGPNFKSCTQIEVLGPASHPVSHWPCPGRDFGLMTPLDEPVVP